MAEVRFLLIRSYQPVEQSSQQGDINTIGERF